MPSILLVDDDPNLLRGLSRALRDQPYDIFTAQSAEIAIDLCKRHTFDLMIVDQRMSGMNGSDLVAWVSEHFPRTIRIMLTGHVDPDVMMDAINRGQVFRFLVKPCHELDLAMAIHDGLEHRLAQSATRLNMSTNLAIAPAP